MKVFFFLKNLKRRHPLARPRLRWEDNIRMNRREIGWGRVDWMHLTQDRGQWRAVVNLVMNLWIL